ncbi:hypothetical protein PYW08_005674 [Mythimna loreyi]|uniref:Uncharacterized protein n=1 Tax=Mythimna loreyi TaxID=667449 RepID=A0ACC2QLA9_9NEOP|nr:hypothetical protein PYW08_005674 [Mythimna loreyi]
MNSFTVLCLFALVALAVARPDGKYTDRYDNFNVGQIIGNRRLLVPYIKCVLDQGKCTPEGKELKSHIREALEQDCAKCTKPQRDGTRLVLGHLINHEVDYWNELKAKYDPKNLYASKHEQELRELKQ